MAVVVACCVWLGLSAWAATRTGQPPSRPGAAAVAPNLTDHAALHPIALTVGLWLALAGHAVFFLRMYGGPIIMPMSLVTLVWAALAAEGQVSPADAVGLAVMVAAWLAAARPEPRPCPVGLAAGAAVGMSYLLIGTVLALFLVLRASGRQWRWWCALGAWLIAGAAFGAALGEPLLATPEIEQVIYKLAPPAVWWRLAELIDLVTPVLVMGTLGAVVWGHHTDRRPAGCGLGYRPAVHRGLAAWLVLNAILACLAPRLCAGHAAVMIAPAALLGPPAWSALRELVSKTAPATTALPGAVCLFLLAVLLWPPAQATGRMLLMALLPP